MANSKTIFRVCDNEKPARFPECQIHSSWKKCDYELFSEAQKYANQWLGEHGPLPENFSPDEKFFYGGGDDYIIIRTIVCPLSQLEPGPELDKLVATAKGIDWHPAAAWNLRPDDKNITPTVPFWCGRKYEPSATWHDAGPLFEEMCARTEQVSFGKTRNAGGLELYYCRVVFQDIQKHTIQKIGHTLYHAICLAYIDYKEARGEIQISRQILERWEISRSENHDDSR